MLEHWDEKRKNNTSKTSNTSQRNKSEGTSERKKTKKISRQEEIIQTKKDIPKRQKKFCLQAECTKTYKQPDDKESKQFWGKIWERTWEKRRTRRRS